MAAPVQTVPYILDQPDQNLEDYRACLGKFATRIRQLSPGQFRGHSTLVRHADFTILRRISNMRYSSTFRLTDEAHLVFALSPGEIFVRGRAFGPGRQMGAAGDSGIHLIFPENSDQIVVSLPPAALTQHLGAAGAQRFLALLGEAEDLEIDAEAKQATTRKVQGMLEGLQREGAALNEEKMRACGRELVLMLDEYLRSQAGAPRVRATNHEKVLERALKLIEARPTHFLDLEELARASFASKRSLQYAFSNILGISPMRYIKLVRLNHIRDELRAVSTAARFSSIINKYSFSNAGRLCREYTSFFGEHPRDTPRRLPGDDEEE